MNIMQLCRPDPHRTDPDRTHRANCNPDPNCNPNWTVVALVFIFFHFGISSCASMDHGSKPFSIKKLESTRIKWIGEKDSIAWLDNDRLLVAGYAPSAKDLGDNSLKAPPAGLYEWNVKTDELTLHSPLGKPWFCYAYGHMRYVVKKNGELFVKEGQYGQEEEKAFYPMLNMDRSTCKPYSNCAEGPRGGSFCQLPGGHSYMEFGRDRVHPVNTNPEPANLWYYPTANHPGIELPIEYEDAAWGGIWYSNYLDGYVIPQSYGVPGHKAPEKGRVWLLSMNGETKEIRPPASIPFRATSIHPVKDGFFSSAGSIDVRKQFTVGTAGAYYWTNTNMTRVLTGLIERIEVSPDGCNVAVVFNPWKTSYRETELNIVDLCVDKGRSHVDR